MPTHVARRAWASIAASVVVLMVALAACVPSVSPSSAAPGGPVVSVDGGGGLVSCGGVPFPPSALADGPDPLAMSATPYGVFGEFIRRSEPDIDWLPDDGWHVLAAAPEAVAIGQFDARAAPGESSAIVVSVTVFQGGWRVTGWGGCRPEPVLPDGLRAGEWWLAEAPGPDDRVLSALVGERSCASGRSPRGRIAPPSIAYGETAVTITIGIRPLEGMQTCPGIPPIPFEIELREPVGDRTLLDGGAWPPLDPARPQR